MKALISDLGGVLLFPKDKTYQGKLNPIYAQEKGKKNFDFFRFFELNTELLNYYASLKKSGNRLFIITEGIIQDDPAVKPKLDKIFESIFSSESLGFSKKDSNLYLLIAQQLSLNPKDVLYIDDNEENIKAADLAGFDAIQFTNNKDLFSKFTF